MSYRIWSHAFLFTLCVFGASWLYAYLHYGRITPWIIQEIFAVASVVVIAPSLALSGIAYFWNFADRYIVYRKSLGLLGFYLALGHVGISLYRGSFSLPTFSLGTSYDLSILAGYLAVLLFACMPLISNIRAIRWLGGTYVRKGLRYLGYTAYILVVLHMVFIMNERWSRWFAELDPIVPPPSLVAVGIAFLVLVLRCALFIATVRARHTA